MDAGLHQKPMAKGATWLSTCKLQNLHYQIPEDPSVFITGFSPSWILLTVLFYSSLSQGPGRPGFNPTLLLQMLLQDVSCSQ